MKELIEQSGLTIKEFAEKHEIPYNTVRQWANGKRKAPQWVKKILNEAYKYKPLLDEIPVFQPKYVYCFINEREETPIRLRRFTNSEDVLKTDDKFWEKRYKEEWKVCDVYRYELKNETKIH